MSARRWCAGLFVISAALLGFELLLMRLLSLAYWGHFAGFVISISMLGIASSGLLLFFKRESVRARPNEWFAHSSGVFGLAAPFAFLLAQELPFTPFLLTWSLHEYLLLGARSLLFFIPFFFGGIAIGTPFVAAVLPMPPLYFWNMLGSGLPALPLLFAMKFMHPMRALIGVTVLAIAAAKRNYVWLLGAVLVVAVVVLSPFRYSEYKDLPKTLLLPEARLLDERYGWDGVVQIVDSPHTRYLPGLSLNFAGELPTAKLVFTDAGAMTLAFPPLEQLRDTSFLTMTPEAFSFRLTNNPVVLNFYGGTAELLRARVFDAQDVRLFDDCETRVKAIAAAGLNFGEARQALEREGGVVDVLGISLLGTHGTATAGAASLDPSFLLTREGCLRLYDRLSPFGHAIISTWVENPPRSGVRLAALLIETLRAKRIANPSAHLLALRSYSTLCILMARVPFTPAAVAELKKVCDEKSFDLVWYDGIDPVETNQNNVLPDEPYYAAFAGLLGPNREQFIAQFPFALDAPTDDRPFFNQYFRWAAVPQWMRTMGTSWLPFVEWGYILQVAAFVVVTLLGTVLLIVPCFFTRTRPTLRIATLFFSLGVAYMFVQLWAIFKLTQFIAHPLLASAFVLSVMLAASGAGAVLAPRRFVLLLGALVLSVALFPLLLRVFYAQSIEWRVLVAIPWLALAAFFMGFPFPTALARLTSGAQIPWALALNGFGSVVGSLLATLVAVHFGFLVLACSAIALYALVACLNRNLG